MQQQEMSPVRLDEMHGAPVYDETNEKIGKVEEIFYDQQTGVPEWIGIGTGFFGTKRVLVPVQGAQVSNDGLRIPYAKDHVKEGPDIDSDDVSQEQEAELAAFYGLDYSERPSDTGLPTGEERTAEEASLTRSEEEIEVGKRDVSAGAVRLRKWVETEPVALDVELHREVAHVTREPINEPVAEHAFEEQELEIPLRGEEPMVQKRTVAKERIAVEKDVESRSQTVEDEVRKERIDFDDTNGDAA